MTSTESPQEDLPPMAQDNCLSIQQEGIIPQNRMILLIEIGMPNKTMLLALSMNNASHQPIPTAAPAPNKIMPFALPANKAPNQPTPTTQLGALALNKTMVSVPLADEVLNQLI